MHDGALRAEIDRPVIGRHRGLDDIARGADISELWLAVRRRFST
jgi:hypothetical protein